MTKLNEIIAKKHHKTAIQLLEGAKRRILNRDSRYVCLALMNASYDRIQRKVSAVIRAEINMRLGWRVTVETWLIESAEINIDPESVDTRNAMIHYRAAWIDSMIAELQ